MQFILYLLTLISSVHVSTFQHVSTDSQVSRHKRKNSTALGIKLQPIADDSKQTIELFKVGHSKSKSS